MNKVVIDTSPLIVLFKTQLTYCHNFLLKLSCHLVFGRSVVEAGKTDLASRELPTVSWVEQTDVSEISPLISAWGLDLGGNRRFVRRSAASKNL